MPIRERIPHLAFICPPLARSKCGLAPEGGSSGPVSKVWREPLASAPPFKERAIRARASSRVSGARCARWRSRRRPSSFEARLFSCLERGEGTP